MKVMMLIRVLDSGGIPTHIMSLAQGLMARGWQVGLAYGVYTGDHDHGPQWFESQGVEVFHVPFLHNVRTFGGWYQGLESFIKLRNICQLWKPDLLHVHSRSASIYARFIELNLKIPFVSTLHLSIIENGGVFKFANYWGKRTIAISQEIYRVLEQDFKVQKEKIDIIYNGVDENFFVPPSEDQRQKARSKFNLTESDFVMCEIARLTSVKRQDVLIRAAHALKSSGRNVKVLLAGTGEREAHLREMIRDFGLEHDIQLCGYQLSREVIWASDINVLPSTIEGFGLVVVEAMFCGVPTIRTPAAGAVDQIIEGETGYIVDFDDADAIAKCVENILNDPKRLDMMSGKCISFARENFTHDLMAIKTEKTYCRVLNCQSMDQSFV